MACNWALNVLGTCLGLRPGEQVLVMVDEPLRGAGEALRAAAWELGARAVSVRTLGPGLVRPPESVRQALTVIPAALLRDVAQADVIVSLLSDLDLERESAPLRAAVASFREGGHGRWAFGAYIDEDVLAHELCADYHDVARRVVEQSVRLEGVREVQLTSQLGTNLRFSIAGRPLFLDTGLLTVPGSFGNLPGGEVFVAPIEESAEGQLVVDLSVGDLLLTEPLKLTFREGRVVSLSGGTAAKVLERRFNKDPWAAIVGEFGIGANPYAQIRGRVSTDEKVLGTVHIALGANQQFGGRNPAATHLDCVIRAPQINLE